jgi:hypothetical protein
MQIAIVFRNRKEIRINYQLIDIDQLIADRRNAAVAAGSSAFYLH